MRKIVDHSPSEYEQNRDAMLLIAADELASLYGYPWIREASEEEVQVERERLEAKYSCGTQGRTDFDELYVHDAVHYLWVVVSASAPGHIWRQATGHLRLQEFKENG